ncbi:hypothetical protein Micbo1qcDRAFT_178000 [Microdochium bolleyi]|uniref:Rhodopsin domain-containing protein n=1 Tax=Microdochium bolleyi TaxID=196109 RepID=A0A136ITK8_9PEZI|nr:hypothetical protein Micbo1qcDRAFT_178000 [Microdochium bolleyi]
MIDADARSVQLGDFPLAIAVITLALLPFAVGTVSIRTAVRVRDGSFGLDDGLLLAGVVAYIADIGLAAHGVSVGIGSKNADMNVWMQSEAQKFYIIWITVYVTAVAFIKSSVCLTLLRVCSDSRSFIKRATWVLLALTWASFCVTFFGILTFRRPVEANWNTTLVVEGKATCATPETLIGISHANTASSIVTDVACVILPGMLLWDTQMALKAKIQVSILLSLASVASVTTMIRAPFISRYKNPTDNLMYYIGFIVLLSCIELAVGLIAASLPAVRRLYKEFFGSKTDTFDTSQNSKSLVTIGGSGALRARADRPKSHRVFSNPSDRGTTTTNINGGEGTWERLHDAESCSADGVSVQEPQSTAGHIKKVHTYSVEMEPSFMERTVARWRLVASRDLVALKQTLLEQKQAVVKVEELGIEVVQKIPFHNGDAM